MSNRPATKLIGLHSAADGLDKDEFRQWFLWHHAPTVLGNSPQIERCIVNLVDVPTSRMNARGVEGIDRVPAYDVITETWYASMERFHEARGGDPRTSSWIAEDLACRTAASFIYLVDEMTELDQAIGTTNGRTHGTKCISSATFLRHIDFETRRRWWDDHVSGTCENLPGLLRYRRNIVLESLSPGAPDEFGIGELHYESLFHAEHIPMQPDVAAYLDFDRTWNLDCSEFVLK